jgi:prepilin-type N-terminal cleavage/methylation domain-containing protein
MPCPRYSKRKPRYFGGFTLIELLTVIVIIAILMALTLAAASGVMKTGARSRARAEIKGMSAALESYKIDNGAYPVFSTFGGPSGYATALPTQPNGIYQESSQLLYQSLTGQTNYGDVPAAGTKRYMTFQKAQLGNDTATAGNPIYIQDPFGYSYGYSTGSQAGGNVGNPNNGAGFFDLWSTAGDATAANQNGWISNWGN